MGRENYFSFKSFSENCKFHKTTLDICLLKGEPKNGYRGKRRCKKFGCPRFDEYLKTELKGGEQKQEVEKMARSKKITSNQLIGLLLFIFGFAINQMNLPLAAGLIVAGLVLLARG